MGVRVDAARDVVVHHGGQAFDIQASRSHICGHEHLKRTGFEALHGALALRLVVVAMQSADGDFAGQHALAQLFAGSDGAAKDEHGPGGEERG